MLLKNTCLKARVCKLFALNSLPYGLLVLSAITWLIPQYKVALAFLIFFYLMISISKFITARECQEQCV